MNFVYLPTAALIETGVLTLPLPPENLRCLLVTEGSSVQDERGAFALSDFTDLRELSCANYRRRPLSEADSFHFRDIGPSPDRIIGAVVYSPCLADLIDLPVMYMDFRHMLGYFIIPSGGDITIFWNDHVIRPIEYGWPNLNEDSNQNVNYQEISAFVIRDIAREVQKRRDRRV